MRRAQQLSRRAAATHLQSLPARASGPCFRLTSRRAVRPPARSTRPACLLSPRPCPMQHATAAAASSSSPSHLPPAATSTRGTPGTRGAGQRCLPADEPRAPVPSRRVASQPRPAVHKPASPPPLHPPPTPATPPPPPVNPALPCLGRPRVGPGNTQQQRTRHPRQPALPSTPHSSSNRRHPPTPFRARLPTMAGRPRLPARTGVWRSGSTGQHRRRPGSAPWHSSRLCRPAPRSPRRVTVQLPEGVTLDRQVLPPPCLPASSVPQPPRSPRLRSPRLRSSNHRAPASVSPRSFWTHATRRSGPAGRRHLGSACPRRPRQLRRTPRARCAHRPQRARVRARFQHSLWVETCAAGVHARLTPHASPCVRGSVLQVAARGTHIHLTPRPHQRRQLL